MFSVDNFYEFFKSHYGWEKRKVLTWIFRDHGSKCFYDLIEYQNRKEHTNDPDFTIGGSIIHHDQEIFIPSSLDTYRHRRTQIKNNSYWLDQITAQDLIYQHVKTLSWPIFCHSEVDSPGIDWIEQQGMIPCYYFWHALIARDWFRHWKHHADLVDANWQWQQRFLLYARDHTGIRQYRSKIVGELRSIQPQVLYDWNGVNDIPSYFSATISVEDAKKSAVHLVAETVFDLDRIHATEKIFKPMVMRQPFIVFANYGMLQYLRRYGFKTFGDIWDESYDQEKDHAARLDKILNLIRELNDRSDTEFHDMMYRCQSILEHNRRHFFSDEFENILLQELHQNVNAALELQSEKQQQDPGGSYLAFYNKYCRDGKYPRQDVEQQRLSQVLPLLAQQDPARLEKISQQYPWVKQFYR